MTNSDREPHPVILLFGFLLMAAGVLIAFTAGACSLIFLLAMLGSGDPLEGLATGLGMMLFYGGIPMAVGAALILAGRAISRRRVTRGD